MTDPPYWINFWNYNRTNTDSKWNKYKANKYEQKEWDLKIPEKEYFEQIFRISKNQIIWGWNYFIEHLKNTQCFIFWDKWQPVDNFADWELAWASFKKVAKKIDYRYYWNIEWHTSASKKEHPTQKPKELFKWCLENYSKPWDLILDCFAWSWTTAVACIETWRDYIVIEKEADYVDIINKRIQNTTPPLFINA